MPSYHSISIEKLARLVGTATSPVLFDVRTEEDFAADPRMIPGSIRRGHATAFDLVKGFAGRSSIVICQNGEKLSEGGLRA